MVNNMILNDVSINNNYKQIRILFIALIAWLAIVFSLGLTKVNAATTNVQAIPLITANNNANNAAQTEGATLSSSIQNAKDRIAQQMNISNNSSSSYVDPNDDAAQASLALDQVTGNHGFINSKQTPEKLFRAIDNIGNVVVVGLIYFTQKWALVLFLLGLAALGFAFFKQRNKWIGLGMMGLAVALVVAASHSVDIFNFFYSWGNSLF